MNILVIPTTDWIHHPVPNRLNFIFDHLAGEHNVYVLHFRMGKFSDVSPRDTRCMLVEAGIGSLEDPSLYYLLSAPYHFFRIRQIVKAKKIDVILSANILPSFFANYAGVPVVFDYLDHLEESASVYYPESILRGLVQWGVRSITRFNLRHAGSVITVTEEFRDYLKMLGIQKISVIPNGVDTKILYPVPKEEAKHALGLSQGIVLGYVGSLEYWVDLETVVKALSEMNASLLVIGPGLFTDYAERLKKLGEEYNVSEKMVFTGPVEYSKIGTYISAMDIGLNPLKKMRKNEITVGGKVFNYLACGRPVLSSRMVSLVRLLGDDLYYYDDVPSFVEQVHRIMRSPDKSSHYRLIAEQYDWGILAKQYEKVLMSVL